jgi:hypothetical protein
MSTKFYITLEPDLMNAIDDLAMREYRGTRCQIRVILIRELQKLGLLDDIFEGYPEQANKEIKNEKTIE